MNDLKRQLQAHCKKSTDLYARTEALGFAQRTGDAGEAEVAKAAVALTRHQRGGEAMRLVAAYRDRPPGDACERAMLRMLIRQSASMPETLVEKLKPAQAAAYALWERGDDEQAYAAALGPVFDIYREHAVGTGAKHPMDVYLGQYEHGITTEDIDRIFEPIKAACIEIVREAQPDRWQLPTLSPQVLEGLFRQAALAMGTGIRYEDTRYSRHAFCNLCGSRDVRIAFDSTGFSGYWGLLHENGHAKYIYETDAALEEWGLWLPASMSLDEAIAILYECEVGKSLEYSEYLCASLEVQGGLTLDPRQLHRYHHSVRPGAKRSGADPAVYALAIIIRYELEKGLLDGALPPQALPSAWREKHREYLGADGGAGKDGLMQDSQWVSGYVGYFPVYLLGRMIAHSLYEKMLADEPHLSGQIAVGELNGVHAFLSAHVLRHGSLYTPSEILPPLIGDFLRPNSYLEHLKEAYQITAKRGKGEKT